jgi:ribosomal protein L37AE/L43A
LARFSDTDELLSVSTTDVISTRAYLYRLSEISTGKWYVGSRTSKNCHPDDGYICSSKIVKPLYKANPQDWIREILVIGNPTDIRKLEADYLKSVDAANDPMSYNMSNGDGKWTTAGLFGELNPFYGRKHSDETRELLKQKSIGRPAVNKGMRMLKTSESLKKNALINPNYGRKGKPHTEETKLKIGIANRKSVYARGNGSRGLPKTQEQKDKQSEIMKNKPVFVCPHCNKTAQKGNASRWHFDNCKYKGNK